jgi:hypothetical protein
MGRPIPTPSLNLNKGGSLSPIFGERPALTIIFHPEEQATKDISSIRTVEELLIDDYYSGRIEILPYNFIL